MNNCLICRHFKILDENPTIGNCLLKREMVGEGYNCSVDLDDNRPISLTQRKIVQFINSIMSQTHEYDYVQFEGNTYMEAYVFIGLWHNKANKIYSNIIKPENYKKKASTYKPYKHYDMGEEPF